MLSSRQYPAVFVPRNDALLTFLFPLPLPSLPAPSEGEYRWPKLLEYHFLGDIGCLGLPVSSLRKLDSAMGAKLGLRVEEPVADSLSEIA